jgi:hypothetical protein
VQELRPQEDAIVPDTRSVAGTRSGLTRKLALLVPMALLLLFLADWAVTIRQVGGLEMVVRRSDFLSTLTGAQVIYEGSGTRLYDLQAQHEAQKQILAPYFALDDSSVLPYNHLPFEALLITPLMGLPSTLVFAVWLLLMAAAVGVSLLVMQAALPAPRIVVPELVLATISYQPLVRAFVLGQNSPMVLLGICGTYAALKSGRQGWAGAALLLVALKPQILPVVLLLLLIDRRWKTLAVFAGLLAALCGVTMPLIGAQWPLDYLRLLLRVANWQDTGAIDPAIMHNWRGFATNLVGGTTPALVTPWSVSLTVASVGVLVWAARRPRMEEPGARESRGTSGTAIQIDLLWALTGVVAVLAAPHLNPHDLTLLIFPGWIAGTYAASRVWSRRVSNRWLFLLWADYVLLPLGFYIAGPERTGLSVVPSVGLMSAAAYLLARQVHSASRRG